MCAELSLPTSLPNLAPDMWMHTCTGNMLGNYAFTRAFTWLDQHGFAKREQCRGKSKKIVRQNASSVRVHLLLWDVQRLALLPWWVLLSLNATTLRGTNAVQEYKASKKRLQDQVSLARTNKLISCFFHHVKIYSFHVLRGNKKASSEVRAPSFIKD